MIFHSDSLKLLLLINCSYLFSSSTPRRLIRVTGDVEDENLRETALWVNSIYTTKCLTRPTLNAG